MKDIRTKTRLTLYVAALIIVGVAVLLLKYDPFYFGLSRDKNLITIFQGHQPMFSKLRKMIGEDRVSYVTEQYIDPNLTRVRWKKYKTLMEEISPHLVMTYGSESTRFIFSKNEFSSIGPEWVKGIEYENNPKSGEIVKGTLDDPGALSYGEVYLRKIQRNWYVFFQKTH